jgi:MFS-type transporter involved in bile tolerance (Atg22 family)
MERFLSQALLSMAAAVAAIILVATAVVFLGAALYLFLVASMSATPPLAALVVGLVGLILAGLIGVAPQLATRCGRRRRGGGNTDSVDTGPAGSVDDLAAKLGGMAAQELNEEAHSHPYRTFVGALLAGLAVGGSPALRDMLGKILKG